MISAEAAAMAVQIAKGLIKLTHRVDTLLAEEAAVEGPLALPAPQLNLRPSKAAMRKGLQALLAESPSGLSSSQRARVKRAVDENKVPGLHGAVIRHLPRLAASRSLDLNGSFVNALRSARPDWAADPDRLVVAFQIGAGKDTRDKSYSWRLALTVFDVVAEFGAENMSLFTRDKKVQSIVGAILRRFGDSDLQTIDSNAELLRAAIGATLNGALDARESIGVENPWVESMLDALVAARSSVGDNFFAGLLAGEGYPALVGALLEAAALRVNDDEVVNFKDVVASFLKQVGSLASQQQSLSNFFQDHWGDLLRAGLTSAERYGPELLGDKKVLGKLLSRVARDLSTLDDTKILSSEALFGIVNSTAAVVAQNPALVNKVLGTNAVWVGTLVSSVADTVSKAGVAEVFSRQGVDQLLRDAFATFSRHPELLVEDNELVAKLLGGVLEELSAVETFAVREIATATMSGALMSLAENPDLLELDYPELVASLAGKVAGLVKENTITGVRASDLMGALTTALAENPELYLKLERKLAEGVLEAIMSATSDRPLGLVAGVTLVELVREVVSAIARGGEAGLKNHALSVLLEQLEALLGAGLTRAQKELGSTLSLPALPKVIGLLVQTWTRGQVLALDADNDNFKALFRDLAKRAA